MAEIRVLRSIREIDKAEWDALVRPEDSPFLRWSWLAALEDAGCVKPEAGWQSAHLTLYDDDELVGVAPAYFKGNSEGEFVFDWRFADLANRLGVEYYPKLLLAVPFTPATGARFLIAKGRPRAEAIQLLGTGALRLAKQAGASGVHVNFLRADEVAPLTELGYRERHGIQYQWHRKGDATFEDFLKRLPSKKRTQLRRERRAPSEQGIEIKTLAPDEYDAAAAKAMHRFYRTTVDKFVWGRRYLNLKFFELLTTEFREHLAWVFAKRDGVPIAGAFNIRGDKTLYGRYWGADEEVPFLHFNVCYYHGVAECLERGLDTFEPGAGGEHKHARGFDSTVTRSVHAIFDPRLKNILDRYFDDEREAIAQAISGERDPDDLP